jgi:hypothetical protein
MIPKKKIRGLYNLWKPCRFLVCRLYFSLWDFKVLNSGIIVYIQLQGVKNGGFQTNIHNIWQECFRMNSMFIHHMKACKHIYSLSKSMDFAL